MPGIMCGRWPLFLLTIITVGSLIVGLASSLCSSKPIWCGVLNTTLTGHVIDSVQAVNQEVCWKECKARKDCKSANFKIATGECDLNNERHYEYMGDLFISSGVLYIYPKTREYRYKCDPLPKLNQTVSVGSTVQSSTAGPIPCPISHRCLDDASCVPSGDSYICTACPTLYYGTRCEILDWGQPLDK